jgi:hypothetical protein
LGGFLQIYCRLAAHHIFRKIKYGEVSSDDFLFAVAFQTYGAGVPTNHVSGRIQLEKGIFPYALDQQAEAFLTISQSSFRKIATCNIFNSYSEEITGEWKGSNRINSLSYAVVTAGNLPQISGLP